MFDGRHNRYRLKNALKKFTYNTTHSIIPWLIYVECCEYRSKFHYRHIQHTESLHYFLYFYSNFLSDWEKVFDWILLQTTNTPIVRKQENDATKTVCIVYDTLISSEIFRQNRYFSRVSCKKKTQIQKLYISGLSVRLWSLSLLWMNVERTQVYVTQKYMDKLFGIHN